MEEIRLNTIDEAIADFKEGNFVIVVDDEDRENEGDFIIAAEKITPEKVNFMMTHGRGVLCAPITEERCAELELDMQVTANTSIYETPFTVTVDLLPARPFNIVTNGDATDPVAVDFIAYCLSKDGQAIATDNGYIGEDGADFTSAQPEGKIVVGGSSSVSPLMEKLIEAYKTVNPNAELELQTTDSTTGVSGALEGTYTIGMASRELKDSEVEGGAKATVLALDGIAVVVNPGNTTDDLTVDQIKGIYTGELTVWSDLQ